MYGGEPEIRTLGGITLVGFQDRCNRPLCQLPVEFKVYFFSKAGGGTRIRTGDQSFAGSCLTAWLCRQPVVPGAGLEPAQCYHRGILSPLRLPISPSGPRRKKISQLKHHTQMNVSTGMIWSGKRGSNSRPQPWQGCALPLSYSRIVFVDWKYSKKNRACKEFDTFFSLFLVLQGFSSFSCGIIAITEYIIVKKESYAQRYD